MKRASFFCLTCVALLLACVTNARGRVVEVGPTRNVRTLDAALAQAASGDEIVLDRVEHVTSGLKVTVDAIEIRSADTPGEPAIIRNVSTKEYATTIEHRAEGLLLKDLVFSGGANVTCVRARGKRLTVDHAIPAETVWRWVQLAGATDTTIRNCDVPKLPSYAVCSFDHDSRNLVIERCNFAGGDSDSHTIRLHRIFGSRLRDCTINADGARAALNIRDGGDNRVENCAINGPIAIGPLADGDGGLNLPTSTPEERARRDTLLRRTQQRITFKNCAIETNGITVEMGSQDVTFDRCRIKTSRPWVLRLNRDEYEPWRNIPTGQVVDCAFEGPSTMRVFEKPRPDFHLFGTTINGGAAPDSPAPASRPASGGGAVPGELSVEIPTSQPSIRRIELIHATSGTRLRELKDGDTFSATISAPLNVQVTTEPQRVGSVRVIYDGASRLDRTYPYTVSSSEQTISLGMHVIEAAPYVSADGTGTAGEARKITFTRRAENPTPAAPATAPATQTAAAATPHRADIIVALNSVEAALEALGTARQRLHASTQPAPAR